MSVDAEEKSVSSDVNSSSESDSISASSEQEEVSDDGFLTDFGGLSRGFVEDGAVTFITVCRRGVEGVIRLVFLDLEGAVERCSKHWRIFTIASSLQVRLGVRKASGVVEESDSCGGRAEFLVFIGVLDLGLVQFNFSVKKVGINTLKQSQPD